MEHGSMDRVCRRRRVSGTFGMDLSWPVRWVVGFFTDVRLWWRRLVVLLPSAGLSALYAFWCARLSLLHPYV